MPKRRHIPAGEFGERLRRLRGSELQKRIAERLGLTQAELSRYERGRVPDAAMLVHIARIYDVTVDYLLTGKHPGAPAARVVNGKVVKFERASDQPPLREAIAAVMLVFEGVDRRRAAELLRILKCLREILPVETDRGRRSRRKAEK